MVAKRQAQRAKGMKRVLKWAGRGLLALVLASTVIGVWKRAEITRLYGVVTLFDQGNIVQNFSHMNDLFFNAPMPRGDGPVSALPQGAPYELTAAAQDWIVARSVTGIVILKDGQLGHESYYLGTGPDDLRISWSLSKSFIASLVGILLADGTIDSIDAPLTQYAPELIGSAYDGATLRNVLQMSSGVNFNEDYLDFWSDINRMGRVLALGGTLNGFAAGLNQHFAVPGTAWHYCSFDTHVLGMIIAGAAGRPVRELMAEKIMVPLGLEAAPYDLTDGAGVDFVIGGLNLRTRDYARFGQMIAQGGIWQGQQIVPADWINAATVPSAKTTADEYGYGYQWWIPQGWEAGEFTGIGIYGQYIYINRRLNVVIAVNSADTGFEEPGAEHRNFDMIRAIANSL